MMYKLRHQKICLSGNFETKKKKVQFKYTRSQLIVQKEWNRYMAHAKVKHCTEYS